ncbi:MAG: phosphoenolpyruvate--protein phosphotransferase [Candidatus Eisenbacteria bacterium]
MRGRGPTSKRKALKGPVQLRGLPVSPGIAVGEVFVLADRDPEIADVRIAPGDVANEEKRFLEAIVLARDEVLKIRTRYRSVVGDDLVRVFDAQIMLLEDEAVVDAALARIRGEKRSAAAAVQGVLAEAIEKLSRTESEYLRDRAEDLKDIQRRVLHHLAGGRRRSFAHIDKNVILIAEDLTPSETVQLPRSKVKAFVTRLGGRTSHTAIMARSLQIPAVVGVEGILEAADYQDRIVVDGSEGLVVLRPDADLLRAARSRQRRYMEVSRERLRLRDLPSVTRDGVEIRLFANVDVPEEVPLAIENRARGIGLFRTEFLYFRDAEIAREEAQTTIYRKILRRVSPDPVVFRTLDVGGDKVLDPLSAPMEPNPMLGWRGIRISLELRDLFRVQVRSLLRASTVGNLSILLPMVTTVEEVLDAKRLIAEAREEILLEGVKLPEKVRIGAMIETPGAVFLAPHIAREVDFLSIGTNDLIQYSLAVDRDNVKVAYLFDPFHPAVAHMVKLVLDAAGEAGIPASICGEMAGEPLCAILLVGLGARELSVHPYLILELKRIFALMRSGEAEALAAEVLRMPSPRRVRDAAEQFLHDLEVRGEREKE